MELNMNLKFMGGAGSVTGSCFIVQNNDFNIMVDCGMFQGSREIRDRNYLQEKYIPENIDALLLTHAHIDHSGLIPKLVRHGFQGKIYATKATTDLCSIMLPDSAHIQEIDTKYINKKNKKLGRAEVDPIYTIDDAEKSIKKFTAVSYNEIIEIHPKVKVRYRDAGHILGSAFIEMWIDEGGKSTKIVFSGDLGPKGQAIIRDPEIIDEADILLIESTYGDRLHKNRTDTYNEFKEIILESHNNKGNIIIPAFAVERTQEIIYTLAKLFSKKEIPIMPVYIDSPLAISATEIFRKNRQCFDDETWKIIKSGRSPLDFKNLYFTRKTEQSKKLNEEAEGAIIISASGMCTAGRIKHHLQHNLYKAKSSVIFVGYQAEGTLGRRLINGANQVRVYGQDVAVKAKIHTLGGFSAHADRDGLIDWVKNINNPDLKIFVVHGEENSSKSLADAFQKNLNLNSYVPKWGEIFNLENMERRKDFTAVVDSYSGLDSEIEKLSTALQTLVQKYNKAKSQEKYFEVQRLQEDISDVKEMLEMVSDEI
jgi:metallo-beta-lactamase family protein